MYLPDGLLSDVFINMPKTMEKYDGMRRQSEIKQLCDYGSNNLHN
jgi:hypothetical protein